MDEYGKPSPAPKWAGVGVRVPSVRREPADKLAWEPRYGHYGQNDEAPSENDRQALAAVVEDMRRRVCMQGRFAMGSAASDYSQSDQVRCDCKYGLSVRYLGDISKWNTEMTGCPELRDLVYLLLHGDFATASHQKEDLRNERDALHAQLVWSRAAEQANAAAGDRLALELKKARAEAVSYKRQAEDERDLRRKHEQNSIEQQGINFRQRKVVEQLHELSAKALREWADETAALKADNAELREEIEELGQMLIRLDPSA